MKLIIDIPEEDYEYVQKYIFPQRVLYEIVHGTPIPDNEPKTGHWMNRGKQGEVLPFYMRYECSICGETADKSNYCPNCGCRMVEPQESEE